MCNGDIFLSVRGMRLTNPHVILAHPAQSLHLLSRMTILCTVTGGVGDILLSDSIVLMAEDLALDESSCLCQSHDRS